MGEPRYFAHSGHQTDRSDWQPLDAHLRQTARLAAARALPLGLSALAELAGLYHDFGKYDPAFDARLQGQNVRVDHSTAGAKILTDFAPPALAPVAQLLAYTILGHHAGLPDFQGSDASLAARLAAPKFQIAQNLVQACQPNLLPAATEFKDRLRGGAHLGFDASVAARMLFSCLVDADYRDTEAFYDQLEGKTRDRDWPALATIMPKLQADLAAHFAGFSQTSALNQQRGALLSHIRAQAGLPPGLFTLTLPTGAGKTLTSLAFALDHSAAHNHRRIIYAIPYTSIIEQTAQQFRSIFGQDVVLEHHSATDVAATDAEGRDKVRLATEDWAAPLVVTTNVQLFESLFAARPSSCRKLHNIAGSVIVLDEAQVLPRPLLLPTLRMIDALAHHYGCTIVLCTATQPAFDSSHLKGGLPLKGRELAPDPQLLAAQMRRAEIVLGGAMDDAALVAELGDHPQALVIVNSRKHALALFHSARAAGLDGVFHLTTRQYPAHRRQIIAEVKTRLASGLPCRLIATSLIEAGVDVDFPVGWRAEAGLDSVVQAAGRVNREGKRPAKDSILTVFTAPENPPPTEVAQLAKAMRDTAAKFSDLQSPEAIRDWFKEVYWKMDVNLDAKRILEHLRFDGKNASFQFRTIAQDYQMIDSPMLPVIIPRDAVAVQAVEDLGKPYMKAGALARILQLYTVQIPAKARALLHTNGKGSFKHTALRGDQFFVLDETALYSGEAGLLWEDADYLSADHSII